LCQEKEAHTWKGGLAMDQGTKLEFAGQQFYIGMDIHKKSWSVSIYGEQVEHKTFNMPPEVGVLVKYLRRQFPGGSYKCVYEAGFSGYWIHDQLREKGVDCLVVNPADVPTKDKERRTKADPVDCRKMARGLRSGDLKGIYVPARGATEDRSLIRVRQSMVRKQTRCKNQIKSLLAFYGISIPLRSSWSRNYIRQLEGVRMERASGQSVLKAYLEELSHLREIMVGLNRELRALAMSDSYRFNVSLLRSIPGIGTLAAMTLLTELFDINRFTSLDTLANYVGLVPDTHGSGEKEYTGEITRRRNHLLRALLIECSWIAVRKDPVLMLVFNNLSKRMTKNRAIIRIARKLLNRIRFVLKNQQMYVPGVVE
jgi:transposase